MREVKHITDSNFHCKHRSLAGRWPLVFQRTLARVSRGMSLSDEPAEDEATAMWLSQFQYV